LIPVDDCHVGWALRETLVLVEIGVIGAAETGELSCAGKAGRHA
jgi:hypothetical protein